MEGQLLGQRFRTAFAKAVATNSDKTTPTFSLLHPDDNASSRHANRSKHPFSMTYRPLNDLEPGTLDPGGEGEGQRAFNAVETALWVGECQSNSSERWGVTWPVCSTRFMSLAVLVTVTVVLGIITLWTILGNVLVLCALYRYRVLRTMSNCLIGNLAVSDLLLAVTVLPISTTNDVLGYWVFGRTMCTLWLCIDVLYCTASIWGLCTIALDRYTATVYPMWYHDKRSPRKALAYMVFVWLFSIVISLAPFIGWRDMIPRFFMHDPGINRYMCILFSSQSYVIYSAVGSFILPLCLMTFMYVQIFVVLHRQADTLKKRPRFPGEFSSRMDTDCVTFAARDSQRMLSRDFTASSFMPDTVTVDRDRGHRQEEEVEEDSGEKDNEVTFPCSRPRFDLDDTGQKGRSPESPSRSEDGEEACEDPLLEQRSNSVDMMLETSRRGAPLLSFPQKDLLTVASCQPPLKFPMKKSRSAAFHFDETPSHHTSATSLPPPPRITPTRSHSISTFCPDPEQKGKELENGHSGRSSLSLQRFSLTWAAATSQNKSYSMNVSLRRRFQLREQRATKRMLLIMACFFVCWVPFTLMYMLRSLCPRCRHLDDHVTAFIIWLGYVNSSLNPLLYTLFNDDFRKAFKKLLGLYRPRRSSATE